MKHPGPGAPGEPYTRSVGTHIDTELVRIDPVHPDAGLIARAADYIRRGLLVAFPTETVYGLGADALSEAAVDRIFVAKGRDPSDPLIVHIGDLAGIERVAIDVPEAARGLVEAFWPGALTLVLERAEGVAPAVSAGRTTVAVRMPSHPVARQLIEAAGVPVAAPSANRFMRTSATTAQHVVEDLDGRVELILDGGPASAGIESTVIDATGPALRLLRPGAVTVEEIRRRVGVEVPVDNQPSGASPGMLARHYAPSTRLRLVGGDEQALAGAVEEETRQGHRVGVLCTDGEAAAFDRKVVVERLGTELEEVARDLYAAIRRLDAAGLDVIVVRDYGEEGLGRAIHDRLRRAATPLA